MNSDQAPPPSADDPAVERVGRCELVDRIGRGGMGVVYRGRDMVIGRMVAIRRLGSDIFSAGAVFYTLLSGRKPFAAAKLPLIPQNVMSVSPDPLRADVPWELAAIVMRALEKAPARRCQRMVEMLASLTRFLQGWERQAREVAIRVCELYQEAERLLAERRARGGQAGEEVAEAPLLRDRPPFRDRVASVLRVGPCRRARITEITRVPLQQHDRLVAERA